MPLAVIISTLIDRLPAPIFLYQLPSGTLSTADCSENHLSYVNDLELACLGPDILALKLSIKSLVAKLRWVPSLQGPHNLQW